MSVNLAVTDILGGEPTDDVVAKLLDEKSIWRPGKATAIGAALGAAYKGYKANKKAKAKGLKGSAKLKAVAKGAAKGAAGGAAVGYSLKLGARANRVTTTKLRHLQRKASGVGARASRAKRALKIHKAKGRLRLAGSVANIAGRAGL